MTTYAHRPTSSFGYWRGGMPDGPLWQNQGSGYGQHTQGLGVFPPGSGPAQASQGQWSPTVTYLFVLILAEMILVKVLERMLR